MIVLALATTWFSAPAAYAEDEPAEAPPEPKPTPTLPVEPPPEPKRRTLLIEGALGMGAPLGWAGIEAIVNPIQAISLHGGVGLGSQGPQIAAGIRGRKQTSPRNALALGIGWSTGQFASLASPVPNLAYANESIWFWDSAHFVNTDGSLEYDARFAVFRPFIGFGYLVNGDDFLYSNEFLRVRCGGDCRPAFGARFVPYFGVALAFGVL